MKTKYYFASIIVLSVISVFIFFSCDKDGLAGDTTKPVIQLYEPAEGQVLKIGEDVHFEMDLSDDVMLKSYKIDIHNNFDHHSHGGTKATEKDRVAFSFSRSYDISGQKNKYVHHHDIVIPDDAMPGDYHLMVYCTDAAGNDAHVAHNIVLSITEGEGGNHEHEE